MRVSITILSTGYVLFYFSELVFWARWQPRVNSWPDWVFTWLAYSVLAYAFLAAAARFRVRSWTALFLCGALYGWLDEGVLVHTMYENFPYQIPWTGLAWHALISVGFGWGYLQLLARDGPARRVWIVSLAAGLAWGVWAIFWWVEPGGSHVSTAAFARFALGSSALLILAYWAGFAWGVPRFEPGRWGPWVIALLAVALFAAGALPLYPWAALVLPPLMGVIFLSLRRNRQHETRPPLTDDLRGAPRLAALTGVLGMPLAAIAFYALAEALGLRWQTNWLIFGVTTPLGVGAFVWSVIAQWRNRSNRHKF